jgi:hypothetical protein
MLRFCKIVGCVGIYFWGFWGFWVKYGSVWCVFDPDGGGFYYIVFIYIIYYYNIYSNNTERASFFIYRGEAYTTT